ncbi:MAG: hypothetical protein ABIO45_09495 [Burkholderiaceae bacterium]
MNAGHAFVASLLGMACGVGALAADNDAAARARLRTERVALQAQFDQRERDCIALAAPGTCIDAVRRERRAALAPLRGEEGALEAAQRRQQALARAAARPSPSGVQVERAQREERSRQAYEARQRAAQAHRDAAAQRQAKAASAAKDKPVAPLPVPAAAVPR